MRKRKKFCIHTRENGINVLRTHYGIFRQVGFEYARTTFSCHSKIFSPFFSHSVDCFVSSSGTLDYHLRRLNISLAFPLSKAARCTLTSPLIRLSTYVLSSRSLHRAECYSYFGHPCYLIWISIDYIYAFWLAVFTEMLRFRKV